MALLRELKSDANVAERRSTSWFWLVGFVVLSLLPALIKTLVGGSEGVVTMCLAVFTVGIAIGSGLAARASHGQPNLGLVPLGALLMGIFALGIAWIAALLVPGPQPIGPTEVLATSTGLGLLACLCGLAMAWAACSSSHRSPPCNRGPRWTGAPASLPPSTCSTPPTWWARAPSSAVLQAVGVGVPLLFAALGVLSIAAVAYVAYAGRRGHARRRSHGV